jgi:3'-5' exoribonuclease
MTVLTPQAMPKVGERISEYVVRVSQLRQMKKKDEGSFYLFRGTNATGQLGCVVWNGEVDFRNGDYLKLWGEVKLHKDAPQVVVHRWQILPREDFPPDTFIPSSTRSTAEMVDELSGVIEGVRSEPVRRLLRTLLLEDPYVAPRYHRAPAAKTHHHPFLGGLLEHNLTVVKRALGLCLSIDGQVDQDIVVAGALLHDIGKIEEYAYDQDSIDFTEVGNLIGHVSLGYYLVRQAISRQGDIPSDVATNILHIVLSHQGRLEYGSPVEPKTAEAFIVHHADTMDAHLWQISRTARDYPEVRLGFSKSLNRMVLANPHLPDVEAYRH